MAERRSPYDVEVADRSEGKFGREGVHKTKGREDTQMERSRPAGVIGGDRWLWTKNLKEHA